MIKVKCGAITKNIHEGALKWYKEAGWKILEEKKVPKKEEKNDKIDSKKITTA